MGVHWGERGRLSVPRRRRRWLFPSLALLAANGWLATAEAQHGYYPPYGPPPSYPSYCPPGGAYPAPGYPPGMMPGAPYAPYAPPGMLPPRQPARPGEPPPPTGAESRPDATRPSPTERDERAERDRTPTQTPDATSPTAAEDAAAADFARSMSSLSGATGTPAAPQSATPNAIGDFFGAPGDRVVIQQPARMGSIPFFPVGGTIANFGESIPALPQAIIDNFNQTVTVPNAPVVFDILNSASGFTSVNAAGQLINRGQIGFLSESPELPIDVLQNTDRLNNSFPNTYFLLNAGDAATQGAIQVVAIQQEGETGSVIVLGGRATLYIEDGYSDAVSNINGPIFADFNNDGDFNDPGEVGVVGDQFYVQQFYLFTPQPTIILVPNPGSGGAIGKVKLADNNSARPQNRVFFDYQYFSNVPLLDSGVDVRRFTPGFERTFTGPGGRLSSFEFRVPMALTLNSSIIADGPNDVDKAEVGNVAASLKYLFYEGAQMQMAIGAALTFPTADDLTLSRVDGTPLIKITNQSVHIVPYLAALFTPLSGNFFGHAFAQLDYDMNGSPVSLNADGTGLRPAGRLSDQTVMFLDGSLGYWVYRNDNAWFSGVATMAEIHYNKSLERANIVSSGNLMVGDRNANLDVVNATLGGHVRLGQTIVTNGVSFPFNQSEGLFDWEYRLFVNRYY